MQTAVRSTILRQLRTLYLDAEAVQAGANSNPLYGDKELLMREALRQDAHVRKALDLAWEACAQGTSPMNKTAYFAMSRRIYLALHLLSPDTISTLDPVDCLKSAQRDFDSDCGPKGCLTRSDFDRCWFQLADLYTDEISGMIYGDWIRALVFKISYRHPESGQWQWRDDKSMMLDVPLAFWNNSRRGDGKKTKVKRRTRSKGELNNNACINNAQQMTSMQTQFSKGKASAELPSVASTTVNKPPPAVNVFTRMHWQTYFRTMHMRETAAFKGVRGLVEGGKTSEDEPAWKGPQHIRNRRTTCDVPSVPSSQRLDRTRRSTFDLQTLPSWQRFTSPYHLNSSSVSSAMPSITGGTQPKNGNEIGRQRTPAVVLQPMSRLPTHSQPLPRQKRAQSARLEAAIKASQKMAALAETTNQEPLRAITSHYEPLRVGQDHKSRANMSHYALAETTNQEPARWTIESNCSTRPAEGGRHRWLTAF